VVPHRAGLRLATVEQLTTLLSILVAPVVVEEIMAGSLPEWGRTRLAIYDSMDSGATPDNLLFELRIPRLARTPGQCSETSRVVLVGGRPLTRCAWAPTAFEEPGRGGRPWLVGVSSLLSSLLALIIWLLGSDARALPALAQRMTADLAHERQRLPGTLWKGNQCGNMGVAWYE
jgi:hypothetical protein